MKATGGLVISKPDARLLRNGQEAKLCFMGRAPVENRNGLVVDVCPTRGRRPLPAGGCARHIEQRADRPGRITLGADKAYDGEDFVNKPRSMNVARMWRPR